VVGRPEHRLAAAVACEHERAGRRATAERLTAQPQGGAQVAIGRHGVARVQAHDRAGLDRRTDGERARLGVGTDDSADEEVALLVLGLAAVDHHAQQQAAGHERLLVGLE
jgi:hypothetical protein